MEPAPRAALSTRVSHPGTPIATTRRRQRSPQRIARARPIAGRRERRPSARQRADAAVSLAGAFVIGRGPREEVGRSGFLTGWDLVRCHAPPARPPPASRHRRAGSGPTPPLAPAAPGAGGGHILPPERRGSAHARGSARGALRTGRARAMMSGFPELSGPPHLAAPWRVAAPTWLRDLMRPRRRRCPEVSLRG